MTVPVFDIDNAYLACGGQSIFITTTNGVGIQTQDGASYVPQYRINGGAATNFRNWCAKKWQYYTWFRLQDADIQTDDSATIEVYLPAGLIEDQNSANSDASAEVPWAVIENSTGTEKIANPTLPVDTSSLEIGDQLFEWGNLDPAFMFKNLARGAHFKNGNNLTIASGNIWSGAIGSEVTMDETGMPASGPSSTYTYAWQASGVFRSPFSASSSVADSFLVRWKGAGSVELADGNDLGSSAGSGTGATWKWARSTLLGDGVNGLVTGLKISVTLPITALEVYRPGDIASGAEDDPVTGILHDDFKAKLAGRSHMRFLQAGRFEDPDGGSNHSGNAAHDTSDRLPINWLFARGRDTLYEAEITAVSATTSTYLDGNTNHPIGGTSYLITHDGSDKFPTGGACWINGTYAAWTERISATQFKVRTPVTPVVGQTITISILRGQTPKFFCDICNELGLDLWWNIPHAASDAWVSADAAEIAANLDSGRKVYVEYSNETWNTDFTYQAQYQHCIAMGLSEGLYGSFHAYAGHHYTGNRSAEIHQLFHTVFNAAGRASDLVRHVSSQVGNALNSLSLRLSSYYDAAYAQGMSFLHPNTAGPAAYWASGLSSPSGGAATDDERTRDFLSGGHDNAGEEITPRTLLDYMEFSLAVLKTRLNVDEEVISAYNDDHSLDLSGTPVKMVCYEGGPSVYNSGDFTSARSSQNWYGAPGTAGFFGTTNQDNWIELVGKAHHHSGVGRQYVDILNHLVAVGCTRYTNYRHTCYPDPSYSGIYGWYDQEAGVGDGSDGKNNNETSLEFLDVDMVSPQAWALDKWIDRSATDLSEHPRMHVNVQTLSALRTKLETKWLAEYVNLVAYADTNYTSLQDPNGAGYQVDVLAFVSLVGSITGKALTVHTAQEYGEKAIEYCEEFVAGTKTAPTVSNQTGYDPHSTYQAIARAYDWAYQYATPTQRANIAGWLADKLPGFISARNSDPGIFSSNWCEREAVWYLAAAIEGDAGLSTAQQGYVQDAIDYFDTEMINGGNGCIPALNWVAREKGGYSEIGNYEWHERRLLLEQDGWRTAKGADYMTEASYTGYPAYWVPGIPRIMAYLLQPYHEWRLLEIGQAPSDSYGVADRNSPAHRMRVLQWCTAACERIDLDMAALAQWLYERGLEGVTYLRSIGRVGSSWTTEYNEHLLPQVLLGSKPTAQSPSALGLSTDEFFEGLGIYVYRSGWTDKRDTVIAYCAYPTILAGHSWYQQHRPRGIYISKYGPLIHARCAYIRSYHGKISPLDIIFTDEATTRIPQWEAQVSQTGDTEATALSLFLDDGDEYVEGPKRRLSHSAFKYILAQREACYGANVTNYTQQMVVVPGPTTDDPDHVVLFYRTATSSGSVRKRIQFGTSYRPTCNGTENVTVGGSNPNGPNIADYTGHTGNAEITIENAPPGGTDPYNGENFSEAVGQAVVSVISPAVKVTIRGGPGDAGYADHTGGYEFWSDGDASGPYEPPTSADGKTGINPADYNDYGMLDAQGAFYVGSFMVEVENAVASDDVNFLFSIQVGHEDDTKRTVEQVTDGTNGFIGAHIKDATNGDTVVLFANTETDGGTRRDEFRYSLTSSGPSVAVRHIVADMAAGTYAVYKNGFLHEDGLLVGSDGVLTWTSTGGSTWSSQPSTAIAADQIVQRNTTGTAGILLNLQDRPAAFTPVDYSPVTRPIVAASFKSRSGNVRT